MQKLGILLKSYAKDFKHAERMVESFHQHNRDNLPLFIVVPDDDLDLFRTLVRGKTELIPESAFAEYLVDEPLWDLRPGYINQEIVKLAFWEKGLAKNYFCADSELIFVRDFGPDDFMFDGSTPYSVLVEDNELKVEPRYFAQHWEGREKHLRHIQELVGLEDRRIMTCHGHQVMSGLVLASLKQDFMGPRGWTYKDLLAEAPYEFSWYNLWLQKSRTIPIIQREPLVKTFHHEGHEMEYALRGISTRDIARGFIGVVVNSNYYDSFDAGIRAEDPASVLARYVDPATLTRALTLQAKASTRRRFFPSKY